MHPRFFSASDEAIHWIIEILRLAKERRIVDLIPLLCFCLNYQSRDQNGTLFESCRDPHFDVGWYHPDVSDRCLLEELEFGGAKLFAPPDTLERLENKHLVLQTLEVGYPNPSDTKRQHLVAVARS
jgi:hypothetical protein